MLKTRLLHPEILSALGRVGHGDQVLIADGNYPVSTEAPIAAARVYLNLRRGLVNVTDVLDLLRDTIPIEHVTVMATRDGQPAPVHLDIFKQLSAGTPTQTVSREEFYSSVKHPSTALIIATGEERRYANILLTIGVIISDQQ